MISAEKIPNNVNLSSNKRLQRALEYWQPKYIQWWRDMGPQGFQDYHRVYVRTAVSVDPEGWAHFEYVKLPEYRWGIFLADPVHDRRIGFGDFLGQPVWQEVPGEFRNQLRRLIVTQGDTEPASVEQQRWLGRRCPSLYDLRNLFQVNIVNMKKSSQLSIGSLNASRMRGLSRLPLCRSSSSSASSRPSRPKYEWSRYTIAHRWRPSSTFT